MKNSFRYLFYISILCHTDWLLAQGGTPFAVAHFVRGQVVVQKAQSDLADNLTKGEELWSGDTVEVEEGSLAVLKLSDGSSIRLGPARTELFLKEHILQSETEGSTKVSLQIGEIAVKAAKSIGDYVSLEVEVSPQVSLGVRGTEFYASREDEETWASLKEGLLDAYKFQDDDHEPLQPGESLLLEKGSTLTRPARFDWSQKLNWSHDETELARPDFFKREQHRQEREGRRQEFFKRKGELGQRMRKKFLDRYMERRTFMLKNRQELRQKLLQRLQGMPAEKQEKLKKMFKDKIEAREDLIQKALERRRR